MSASPLIKDFKSKDVARMRNLITKNNSASSATQVGYKKIDVEHKEGDIWEENGKKWTIKNGIKGTISKLSLVKSTLFIPLVCPQCQKPLKSDLDKKVFRLKSVCLDCNIKFEDKLKIEGKYEEYEKNIFNKNIDVIVKDVEAEALDFILNGAQSMVTESGETEEWNKNNINADRIHHEVKEWTDKLKELYI